MAGVLVQPIADAHRSRRGLSSLPFTQEGGSVRQIAVPQEQLGAAGVPPRSDLWTSDAGVEEPVDRPACVRQGRQEQRRSGSGGALAAPSTSHRQPFFAIEPLRPAAPGRAGPCRPEPACKRSRMCVSRLMMSIVSGRRKSLGSGWALSDVNL